jgi:hypothetical protein
VVSIETIVVHAIISGSLYKFVVRSKVIYVHVRELVVLCLVEGGSLFLLILLLLLLLSALLFLFLFGGLRPPIALVIGRGRGRVLRLVPFV